MRVGVVVATLGRPYEVGQLLAQLGRQTLAPAKVVVSATSPADLPAGIDPAIAVVMGTAGLAAQRNRGLDRISADCDLVAFLDDDYLPAADALARMSALFTDHTDIVGADGFLLADGIGGAGIGFDEAMRLLRHAPQGMPESLEDIQALYGCNMVLRTKAIGDIRFDEKLPLYGWQEDFDCTFRLAKRGRLVRTNAFAGVHRGVKTGRTSGMRFGYSQIANPIYLARKGSMPKAYAVKLMVKNLIANHVRSLKPEPWVDRWGRVRGNWVAFLHVLRGQLHPQRVLDLP